MFASNMNQLNRPEVQTLQHSSSAPAPTIPLFSSQNQISVGITAVEGSIFDKNTLESKRVIPIKTIAKSNRGGRGQGSKNYNSSELDFLLTCVEEVLPLGQQHWAEVANKYETWRKVQDETYRDIDSLKMKFDKLSRLKKPTGSADCPPAARRAKKIARAIQAKAVAATLGIPDNLSEDCNEMSDMLCTPTNPEEVRKADYVGKRSNARDPGSAGIKMRPSADPLVQCAQAMVAQVTNMTEALTQDSTHFIEQIVRKEVENAMKDTKDSLSEMQSMLRTLLNRGSK